MTTVKVGYQRLRRHWAYQTKLLFSVVDWVVALYFVVPGLLIAGYHYIHLWQGSYTWPEQVSFITLVAVLYIWSLMGRFNLFVEEADQILLRQHRRIFKGIQRYAILYSCFRALVVAIILFFLLAPILINYFMLSFWRIALLFCLTYGGKLLHYTYKIYLYLPYNRWRKAPVAVLIFLTDLLAFMTLGWLVEPANSEMLISLYLPQMDSTVFYLLYSIIICLIYYLLTIILMVKRTSLPWSFQYDCAKELEEKYRTAGFLLQQSMHIGGPDLRASKKSKKASLFRFILPSRKLEKWEQDVQPKGVTPSIFYRFLIRNTSRFFALLRVTGVFVTAIVLTPGLFKWGMWLFAIVVLIFYLRGVWNEWVKHEYVQLFDWRIDLKRKEAIQALFICSFPPISILSFILGMIINSIWLGFLLISLGLIISLALLNFFNIELKQTEKHNRDDPELE